MHHPLIAQLENVPRQYYLAAAAIGGLVLLIVVVRVLRRRKRPGAMPPADLTIDVADLGDEGPPRTGPQLELYNVPVRLSGLIVAPTGRGNELDPNTDMADIVDHIVPGLGDFIHLHQAIVRQWPPQLEHARFRQHAGHQRSSARWSRQRLALEHRCRTVRSGWKTVRCRSGGLRRRLEQPRSVSRRATWWLARHAACAIADMSNTG